MQLPSLNDMSGDVGAQYTERDFLLSLPWVFGNDVMITLVNMVHVKFLDCSHCQGRSPSPSVRYNVFA